VRLAPVMFLLHMPAMEGGAQVLHYGCHVLLHPLVFAFLFSSAGLLPPVVSHFLPSFLHKPLRPQKKVGVLFFAPSLSSLLLADLNTMEADVLLTCTTRNRGTFMDTDKFISKYIFNCWRWQGIQGVCP
jgi:hypothetical protein